MDDRVGYEQFMVTVYNRILQDNNSIDPEDHFELLKLREKHTEIKRMLREGTLTRSGYIEGYENNLENIITKFIDHVFGEEILNTIRDNPQEYQRFMHDMYNIVGVVNDNIVNGLYAETNHPSLPSYLQKEVVDKQTSSILFSELHKMFLEHKVKSGLSKTLQAEYKRFLSDWNELVEDKPIDEYKRRDFKEFILNISNLPKRNLREYKGKTVIELLELDVPENHGIAPRTATQYKKWLQGVFSYSVEQELLGQSPVKNLKLNLDISKTYSNYTNTEVRSLILSAEKEATEWHKWLVLIGAYTGMRLGEINGLVKGAIKSDEETGIDYILVTDKFGGSLKTVAAKRLVPIHSKLIEAGFMDWLSRSSDKLFSVESKTMTQWFSQFRENCNIERYSQYDERKVFHSFRHTVITMARSKGVGLDKIQQVIGHEKTSAGITDRYTHEFPLKELQEVIESIDYEY